MAIAEKQKLDKARYLIDIGIALSAEKDQKRLLEKILTAAKELTLADGGTLYTVTEDKMLHFEILISDSLKHRLSAGTSGEIFPDILLFFGEGKPNNETVATYAVNQGKTVNVPDAYDVKGFDFSGTRLFDKKNHYRTRSLLTVPIKSHEGEVIACLQLVNRIDPATKTVVPFSKEDQELVEAFASQAGVALSNTKLIQDLRALFESFIRVIAEAIDEKSPSTGNHGKRVPVLALLIAEAVNAIQEGPLKGVHFNKDELYELHIAAYLHDCGKITTPEFVVEKHTKLETIFDRMELIDTRFEVLKRDLEIVLLKKKLARYEAREKMPFTDLEKETTEKISKLKDDQEFISRCNQGQEPITDEPKKRMASIQKYMWVFQGKKIPFLTEDEMKNLLIASGNLTDEERKVLQNHVVMTLRMLSQLHYPKELRNVPEIAGSHHERVDGKGYPRGLKGREMPLRARIVAIADVFEALSAPDRPYKKALPLSEVLSIMKEMAATGHLDPDLFDVFMKEKVYLAYGKKYLAPEQLDVP